MRYFSSIEKLRWIVLRIHLISNEIFFYCKIKVNSFKDIFKTALTVKTTQRHHDAKLKENVSYKLAQAGSKRCQTHLVLWNDIFTHKCRHVENKLFIYHLIYHLAQQDVGQQNTPERTGYGIHKQLSDQFRNTLPGLKSCLIFAWLWEKLTFSALLFPL